MGVLKNQNSLPQVNISSPRDDAVRIEDDNTLSPLRLDMSRIEQDYGEINYETVKRAMFKYLKQNNLDLSG